MVGYTREVTMTKIETTEVIAPAAWATALLYGDFTGIDDDAEIERVEAFMDGLPGPVVGVIGEPEFRIAYGTDTPNEFAGDFLTYTVQVLER